MPVHGTRRLIVVPPAGCDITWSEVGQILTQDVRRPWAPDPRYPVRRRRWRPAMLRGSDDLLDITDGPGATPLTAGGRLRNLDLVQLGNQAFHRARARWWAWKTHVARSTPPAQPWETYLDEHQQHPATLPLAQARHRFEAQPRVLAMIALNSHPTARFRLDPYELAAYQAGEVVYTTLCWQTAIVGDGLVDPDAHLHRVDAVALADRLRQLRAAHDLVHSLTPQRYLAAVTVTLGPSGTDRSVAGRPIVDTPVIEPTSTRPVGANRTTAARSTVDRTATRRS